MKTRVCLIYFFHDCSNANDKYLKYYDPKQESNHILGLETNNLCDYAISKFLLTDEFKLTDPKKFDSNKYRSNSSIECVLEINLKY